MDWPSRLIVQTLAAAIAVTGEPAMALDPPGVSRDPALTQRLEAAYAAKGPDYVPRTNLLDADGRAQYVNRLILAASPYLLQHAHNPVDWRPWGPEALAEAEALDRPVFLSVGYATCHWCHVMEEESFDNEAVAQILNTHFVPVKIDREQHPALDHIYITATQLQQGHAGWPNSLFLLPDGRPFHTGTYFPRPNFIQLLQAVVQAWRGGKRSQIEGVATQLADAIHRFAPSEIASAPPPGEAEFKAAAGQLAQMENTLEGGFSNSQQFPQEGFLLFLIDRWRRDGDSRALAIASNALNAIAAGGIHDHVGGGFHRYTVDPNWRTPHFEKMLYNQGQLARAFIEGWEATGNPAWRRAAERCFAYVLRDMTDPDGAFYAAEDADSRDPSGELEEGAFYVWPPDEARTALGTQAELAIEALGLTETPTLEAGPVAHLDPTDPPDFAALDPILDRLLAARDARARPLRDDKVITGWNGLMIRALAEGAAAFENPAYSSAAARAAGTLWSRLWSGERLMRFWAGDPESGGGALEDGALEDYAWFGLGLLAIFDATGEALWRDRAALLAKTATQRFGDGKGRLRMAAADGPLGPVYDSADGATPAGESAMLELLARLARRTGDPTFTAEAETLRGALAGQLAQAPLLRPDALIASRIMEEGESGLRRTLARGTVRARLAPDGRLTLRIAPGWHLNAHRPGADWLTGATIDGAAVDWPEGNERALGFADKPVRVYEDRLQLNLDPTAQNVTLHLQACSDSLCLEPETTTFRLR